MKVTRLYKTRTYRCYYCDSPCDTVDHVPPQHLVLRVDVDEQFVVEACNSCNNLLNGVLIFDLKERRNHIAHRLTLKYSWLLKDAHDDAARPGAGLGDEIGRLRGLEASLRSRLNWLRRG